MSVGASGPGGWQIEHPLLSDYAPAAIAESLAQLVGAEMPAAVMAAGTERGNEVMAHLAALLDLPLAANVTRVAAEGDDWKLTRVRWGGSLLEEATLTAVRQAGHRGSPLGGGGAVHRPEGRSRSSPRN